MRELTAALILRTTAATVAEITAALGIAPSSGVNRGDIPHAGRRRKFQEPYKQTAWILRSEEGATATLIDHLHALAHAIPPERLREALAKLPPDLSVEIDVAVFYEGQAGYVDFDRESLRMLNDYTAHLTVTMYYCEEDE